MRWLYVRVIVFLFAIALLALLCGVWYIHSPYSLTSIHTPPFTHPFNKNTHPLSLSPSLPLSLSPSLPLSYSAVIECDPRNAGLVIGPGGDTIKGIQEQTGARIDVDSRSNPCRITILGTY